MTGYHPIFENEKKLPRDNGNARMQVFVNRSMRNVGSIDTRMWDCILLPLSLFVQLLPSTSREMHDLNTYRKSCGFAEAAGAVFTSVQRRLHRSSDRGGHAITDHLK